MSGLIVVAGATNSAKSLVTRGLIHLFLKNVVGPGDLERRPHLVTLEDPIEKYYAAVEIEPTSAHPQIEVELKKAREMHIDYTPRQLDSDVGNLGEALNDALRQTPKVFFVGETREKKDWRALIDFAGTGHLIVTTAHAGSLVEAMHKIFLATRAVTPADRGEVAGRLLAVIHLKRAEVVRPLRVEPNQDPFDYKVLVPALWRRVPMGLNALTAEGLASILPHSHSDENNPCSCLGRRYFARHLPELAGERLASNEAPALSKDFTDQLQLQATSWDLQGV